MLRQRTDQAFLFFVGVADVALTCLCWLAAYFLRWQSGMLPAAVDTPPFWWCARTLPIVAVVSAFAYRASGLYQLGRRWSLARESLVLLRATGIMLLLLLAATFYFRDPYESRIASLLFWVTTFFALLGVRRGLGAYFRLLRRRGEVRGKALVVGTGRLARTLAQSLADNNWLGITPFGFVDDPSEEEQRGPPTVGAIDDLADLVDKHGIDYVFIALPLSRYAQTKQIFRKLANTLVEIRLVPEVPYLEAMTVQVNDFDGLPVLSLRSTPHGYANMAVKRAMDVVLSVIGLIVLAPFFAIIAAIIKLSDGGPVFYRQERMGLNGHRFDMYKFRSMKVNAESATGPVWAQQGDDRRTRFGTFLRETSLDEFPQLLNVLKGDMSLVGPRPERPHFIDSFRHSIPRYMLRHSMKAGITGWAQVNGWRGNTSLRKRVQYDLYYISNWSLLLDLRIMFLTIFRAMWDKHAY